MKELMILCFFPFLLFSQVFSNEKLLDPFFSYSLDELQNIRSLSISKIPLSQQKFEEWDQFLYEISSTPRPDGKNNRLMAYVYAAQRDFALLSYQATHQWIGSPDRLIIQVIRLFDSNFQSQQSIQNDLYSEKVGEIVFRKIEARLKDEDAHLQEYPLEKGAEYWWEEAPYGQRIGTCKPWLLTSLRDLQAIPPPGDQSIIWAYGLNQIRYAQAHLTPEQRQLILYWAGEQGPKSGNWCAIVNQSLQKKDLSLQDFLFVRFLVAITQTDAMIAAFDSKYKYHVRRPHMRDPNIAQIISVPKHPSYPSAHSVVSSAIVTVLFHLFPTEKEKWQKLAFEACNTRIWAGLHYMYDNEQGLIQGEKVGRTILERLNKMK